MNDQAFRFLYILNLDKKNWTPNRYRFFYLKVCLADFANLFHRLLFNFTDTNKTYNLIIMKIG